MPIIFINDLVMCSCNFWQLVANNMTQSVINNLCLELIFVHMMGIPTTSSKIINTWLVLSLHKQSKLWHSRTKIIKWWPLVFWTWNCIDRNSLCMANSFTHEQLKATRNKFDVSKISLNSRVVISILKSICLRLMASTSWLLGILVWNFQRNVAKSGLFCGHFISIQ
jgi:hypothetical protein